MADRQTPAPAEQESRSGQEQETQAAAVLEDQEALRSQCAAAEKQRDEYLSLLRRTRADFENYQKRIQRDLAEERKYAPGQFVRELLPVLDNLERALGAARQQGENNPLVQGVAMVQSQLRDILGRFGVTPIDAEGQPFDPNLHEAVMQRPEAGTTPGTVVEVLEPGYRLHERVLRPARVVVAAPRR